MKEELFLKVFGNETSLRMFYALHLKGESSLYRIYKTLGITPSGLINSTMRSRLKDFTDLGILQTRTINYLAEGTRVSANPRISKSHVEYRLDNAHPLMPGLRALFEEIRLNGSPRPW
jgi:hypothetical protein